MSDKLLGNLSDEMEEPSSEFMSSVEGEPAVPIEELALDVRLKLAQKFNFFKYAKTGDFLDAQDTISMWCMATIEEMTDETKILVHYDGWSSKWDQVRLYLLLFLTNSDSDSIPSKREWLPSASTRVATPASRSTRFATT